jgi:hypothetical protein
VLLGFVFHYVLSDSAVGAGRVSGLRRSRPSPNSNVGPQALVIDNRENRDVEMAPQPDNNGDDDDNPQPRKRKRVSGPEGTDEYT